MIFVVLIALICIINTIVIFPYRRRIRIINVLLVGIIVAFLSSIQNTPDISNYMLRFSSDFYSSKDIAFNSIARYFFNHGLDYFQFQTIIYLLSISLICQGLIRTLERRTFVYVMYCIFPLMLNAVQMKFMLATSIFVFAFCITSNEANILKRRIIWTIATVIATSIHIIMLVFVPFIFICDKEKILSLIAKIGIAVGVLMLIMPSSIIGFITNLFSLLDSSSRTTVYTDIATTKLGAIVMVLEALILYYFSSKLNKYCEDNADIVTKENDLIYTGLISRLMRYSLVFVPLYIVNGSFTRLIQCDTLLLYGLLSIAYEIDKSPSHSFSVIRLKKDIILPMVSGGMVLLYHAISLWILDYDAVIRYFFN